MTTRILIKNAVIFFIILLLAEILIVNAVQYPVKGLNPYYSELSAFMLEIHNNNTGSLKNGINGSFYNFNTTNLLIAIGTVNFTGNFYANLSNATFPTATHSCPSGQVANGIIAYFNGSNQPNCITDATGGTSPFNSTSTSVYFNDSTQSFNLSGNNLIVNNTIIIGNANISINATIGQIVLRNRGTANSPTIIMPSSDNFQTGMYESAEDFIGFSSGSALIATLGNDIFDLVRSSAEIDLQSKKVLKSLTSTAMGIGSGWLDMYFDPQQHFYLFGSEYAPNISMYADELDRGRFGIGKKDWTVAPPRTVLEVSGNFSVSDGNTKFLINNKTIYSYINVSVGSNDTFNGISTSFIQLNNISNNSISVFSISCNINNLGMILINISSKKPIFCNSTDWNVLY